ncbi:hypothetical protein BDR04DRAFT_1117858 [Suillus decipiens]|nr:hypothetical protein BDR04DRAFT_1117858 [Suillus decipiens]
MEYSSDDIAAARSLRFSTFIMFHQYIYVSMVTFWSYDYWTFLLRSNWSKVKCLYIVARYLPFILLTTNLYMIFTPNETSGKCRMLANIDLGFFILRTFALWDNNKILLAVMVFTFSVFLIASFSIAFTTTVPTAYAASAISSIAGCYQSSTSSVLFVPFLLLTVFELALMVLTLICAIRSWRINSSRLYTALVNHNIFYYACGLLFSVMNIFTLLLFQYSYRTILHDFQFIILAILATRMHLHLWQISRPAYGSGAPGVMPYLVAYFVSFKFVRRGLEIGGVNLWWQIQNFEYILVVELTHGLTTTYCNSVVGRSLPLKYMNNRGGGGTLRPVTKINDGQPIRDTSSYAMQTSYQ